MIQCIFFKLKKKALALVMQVSHDSENLDIHIENTIYSAIMYNDLEKFISFTGREGFDEDQMLKINLYSQDISAYSFRSN